MSEAQHSGERGRVVGLQERRLGPTVLRTYRTKIDIDDIVRQRREWYAREKGMVAYRLVDLVGRASAANILGISLRELDRLVDVFELSARFTGLRDPSASISWARELSGLSKKMLTPEVV